MTDLKHKSMVHVLDDDLAIRNSLQFMLQADGFKVKTHENLSSFLSAYQPTQISCLLLDVRLCESNGLDIQQQLTSTHKITVPIIFMSGHADIRSAQQGFKNGCVGFLEKPCEPAVLIKQILKALKISLDAC